MTNNLTVPQKIIVALSNNYGEATFTIEQLAVAAWGYDRQQFGLAGFIDKHPNSNVIYAAVMGWRGMEKRGWLQKIAPKLYRLTPQALAEAARIKAGNGDVRRPLPVIMPGRDCEARLTRSLISTAAIRYRSGQKDSINVIDALHFWGADTDCDPAKVEAIRLTFDRYLREAMDAVVGDVCRFRSGQECSSSTIVELGRCSHYLVSRFEREFQRRKAVKV